MRITIDTKEDSHEDIKQVLNILSNIIRNKDQTAINEPVDTTNMMSMFGNSNQETTSTQEESSSSTPMSMFTNPEPQKEVVDTPPDFTSLLNLAKSNKNQDEDEEPKVQLF